jgi:hypothetical protein
MSLNASPCGQSDQPAQDTARKYSNAGDRERLQQAATERWPAPTTANDLAAESSHLGAR